MKYLLAVFAVHLLPHPADRPHLYAGKYTEDYLLSVSRGFSLTGLRARWWYLQDGSIVWWVASVFSRASSCQKRAASVSCVRMTVTIDVWAAFQVEAAIDFVKTGSFPPLYATRIIRMSWCAISSQLFSLQIFQVMQVLHWNSKTASSLLAPSIVGVATSSFPLRWYSISDVHSYVVPIVTFWASADVCPCG